MEFVFEQSPIVALDVVQPLESLVPGAEVDLVLVSSVPQVTELLFLPKNDFLLAPLAAQVVACVAVFLSQPMGTFAAALASPRMISLSLSTRAMLFLIALIDCSFWRDLTTNVLRDFLVDTSSLSRSLTWFWVY